MPCDLCEAESVLGSHATAAGWERLFWSVFERSTNAIALVDEERIYLEANPALCALLGASREEIVGQRADRFIAPEELATLESEWRRLWETRDWVCERTLVRGDGSRVRGHYAARTSEIAGRSVAVVVWAAVDCEDDAEPGDPTGELGRLTAREREVLSLLALGQTSAQIAEQLHISTETVRTHVRNAMAKTGARTRAQLVAIALADRHIAAPV
jgi:PAS domain S-box-containing protein